MNDRLQQNSQENSWPPWPQWPPWPPWHTMRLHLRAAGALSAPRGASRSVEEILGDDRGQWGQWLPGGMSRNHGFVDSNWMSNMVKASTLEGIQFYGFHSGWRGKTVEAIKQRSSKVGHVVPWLIPLLWRSAPIHASWSSSRNDLHMAESRLVSWGLRVRHPWSFFVCRGLGSNMTNTLWAIGAPLVGSFISASNSTLLFELGTNNKPHQATNSWS